MKDEECNGNVQNEAPVARAPASGDGGPLKILQSMKWRSMRRQDSKIFKLRNGGQIHNAIWRQEQIYRKCKETFRSGSPLLHVNGHV